MHTNSAAQRRTRHFGIMAAAFLGLASMKPLYTPIIFFANQTIAMISILSENGWALRPDDKQQKRNARFEAGKWWFVLCLFSFCFCVIWDWQTCHLCGQIGCPSIRGDNRHLLPTHPPPLPYEVQNFQNFRFFLVNYLVSLHEQNQIRLLVFAHKRCCDIICCTYSLRTLACMTTQATAVRLKTTAVKNFCLNAIGKPGKCDLMTECLNECKWFAPVTHSFFKTLDFALQSLFLFFSERWLLYWPFNYHYCHIYGTC